MAKDHDSGYNLLFSHPEMVRDLLIGFVQGEWIKNADFSTLTQVNGSYVSQSDELEQRHDDLVWKVRIQDRWLYVYLLLEFQSTIDPHMALRMMVYVGLLYQDLAKRKEFTVDKKLPPVLPIVLYNGTPRWTAPVLMEDLVTQPPAGLESYVPRCRYLLIDEGQYGADVLNPLRNLVAALFRLETQRSVSDMCNVFNALIEWLKDEDQRSLRRSFTIWIKQFLRTKVPDVNIDDIKDLEGVGSMFGENLQNVFDEVKEKGRQAGLQEGRQEGEVQGLQKGEALALQRLLSKRFGAIPSNIIEQISAASVEQIEIWFDSAIDARELTDVFGVI
jgi:predicted transposase YdaD